VDPVSLIVAALVAGAAAGAGEGVKETAKDVVVSLYGRLKAAVVGRAAGDPAAEKMLERHAGNPQGYEIPVQDLVTESGASSDEQIVALARQLLEAADPAGAQVGRYNVKIEQGQGVQVGDHNTQHNTFGPAGDLTAGRDINAASTINVDNRTGRA